LRSIHNEPSKHWSVSALAREAALSRSLFAERFAQLCGRAAHALRGVLAHLTCHGATTGRA
jgi:AraC-like DNA-binding protein